MLIVRRAELLRVLADAVAGLGGDPVLYGAEVFGLIGGCDSVRGVGYRREGEEGELRAWCVAGADGLRSAVRRELAIPLRTWGDDQRYVVGIGPRPAELEDGAALVYHGTGYADGVMPLGQNGYFYDGVTPANRAAVDAGDLDGWRAIYSERVPYAAELTAAPRSWDDLSVLGTRPGRVRRRIAAGAALLGDAAASVHPHSAQGANLALEDAVATGELWRPSIQRASFDAATSRRTSAGAGARAPAMSPGRGLPVAPSTARRRSGGSSAGRAGNGSGCRPSAGPCCARAPVSCRSPPLSSSRGEASRAGTTSVFS
jgi:2-polyprenyl-6-methoxyphenol hydroxylase-like FAD-dependent oxidoreductase